MKADLTYTSDAMFTRFYPETKYGESVYNEMASKMNGVAAVANFEAQSTIALIRAAGYKVSKAKPVTQSIDSILAELEV